MRTKIILLAVFFCFAKIHCQDTLYFISGTKKVVKLIEIQPERLLYTHSGDSLNTTDSIQKTKVHFIVYGNGKKEVLNEVPKPMKRQAHDTMFFISGKTFLASVQSIEEAVIRYRLIGDSAGPVYTAAKAEMKKITFENGRIESFEHLQQDDYKEITQNNRIADAYQQGKQDAIKHYRHPGGSIGIGILSVAVTPLGSFIPALIIKDRTPKFKNLGIKRQEFPLNPDYLKGYTETAHKIKKKRVWIGFGVGSAIFGLLVIAASH